MSSDVLSYSKSWYSLFLYLCMSFPSYNPTYIKQDINSLKQVAILNDRSLLNEQRNLFLDIYDPCREDSELKKLVSIFVREVHKTYA
ncbi:hypothetical protein [Capybara microvirus Cap3_SP_457]|nr:hypothetical protein [Capybara microvirus Cap3_SP_457]